MSITISDEEAAISMPTSDGNDQHWYAAYTCPRHEKKVFSALRQRGVEAFLPTYQIVHRWKNGVKASLELVLFPGYVFVQINLRDQLRALTVPSLITLVGFGTGPASLPSADIDALKLAVTQSRCEPHPLLQTGQQVMVKSGPLAGTSGILVDRRSRGCRLVINFELVKQACVIEVDACDVDVAGSATVLGD
jgi:transcription antitermination factor NusG